MEDDRQPTPHELGWPVLQYLCPTCTDANNVRPLEYVNGTWGCGACGRTVDMRSPRREANVIRKVTS